MKVELTLLELNELYYLTSKELERQTQAIQNMSGRDTMNYYVRELSKVKKLRDKLSEQLSNEVKELEETREYVENKQRDYSAFKEYADSMNEAQAEDRALGNI